MKKILLMGIFLFTLLFNVSNVYAEENINDLKRSEIITDIYFNNAGIMVNGEDDEAAGRNYRLDADYYLINDTIVAGMQDFEKTIDIQGYSLDYTDDNVEKLLTIVTDDVFREVYYADSSIRVWYSDVNNKIYYIEVGYAYETDGSPDIEKCSDLQYRSNQTIENSMKLIADDMEDIDKALILHDYLVDKISYVSSDIDQTAGSALADFETVCAGYAKAYSVLLDEVGIENYYVTGLGGGVAHGWNIINIEGNYYHVDLTWNDLYGPTSGIVNRKYFLMSDAEISSNRHSDWDEYVPDCPSAEYNNEDDYLFEIYRDFGYFNYNFYFLDGLNLKYGTINDSNSSSSTVNTDFTEYDGGDLYQQYVYMYDSDVNRIYRYDILSDNIAVVYSYDGSGDINGIEVDDLNVLISTTDGQLINDELNGNYDGNITVTVNTFEINEPVSDNYTISGTAKIVSTYEDSEHKIEELPTIKMVNLTDENNSEFNVARIDDYNYSFNLTFTSSNSVLNDNNSIIVFEDNSINNLNNDDSEILNTSNSPLSSSNEWRFEDVVINSEIEDNSEISFTIRNKLTEEEVLSYFYDYTLGSDNKYKVSISSTFETKLNNSLYQEYTVEDYTWKTGDALLNPAPDGLYDGVEVNDMSELFADMDEIVNLDLSLFDTSNVTDMSKMFDGCISLETVDLSSFDTASVIDMKKMFEDNISLSELDIRNFEISNDTDISLMFNYSGSTSYEDDKFIQGYAKDVYQRNKFNNNEVTGITLENFKFEAIDKSYAGNINSELIDLQINPIDDGTGDYVITGKVVVVEWIDGISTIPEVTPIMAFVGEYGDKMDVFVTAEGTNTYYFDRRISSEGLVDGQDFRFEITSGDSNNISENKSMYLYLSTSPNVEQEKSFRISDTKSISYEMDTNGQLIIFNEDDPYDYIGNINSQLINLDVIEVNDGTGDVVITGEVVVVEWINASDPMGDPNDDPLSTVPKETPIMNFVAADGSESISVFVSSIGTNTFYFDRRVSGEGLTEGKVFNFNIKSGNERNLSEYNNVNLYLSTSTGVEKYREFVLPSGKILQYYENGIGELELSNKTS